MLIPSAIKTEFFEPWAVRQALKHGYKSWRRFDRAYRKQTCMTVLRYDHNLKKMRPFTDSRSLFDVWLTHHLQLHGMQNLADNYMLLPRQVRDDLQAKVCRIKTQIGMRWHKTVEHDGIIRVGPEAKAHM